MTWRWGITADIALSSFPNTQKGDFVTIGHSKSRRSDKKGARRVQIAFVCTAVPECHLLIHKGHCWTKDERRDWNREYSNRCQLTLYNTYVSFGQVDQECKKWIWMDRVDGAVDYKWGPSYGRWLWTRSDQVEVMLESLVLRLEWTPSKLTKQRP